MDHRKGIAVMTGANLRLPDAGAHHVSLQRAQHLPWLQLLLTQEELQELHLSSLT